MVEDVELHARSACSVGLDLRGADDRRPALEVGCRSAACEIFRRAGQSDSAPASARLSRTSGSREDRVHLGVEQRDLLASAARGGPSIAYQMSTSMSVTPSSASDGTSGVTGERCAPPAASIRSLPACTWRQRDVDRQEHHLHLPAEQIGDGAGGSLVRDMRQVDAEVQLEELHREVMRRAAARRGVVELAGLRSSRARRAPAPTRAGTEGWTTSARLPIAVGPIGVKPFTGSYGTLACSAALVTMRARRHRAAYNRRAPPCATPRCRCCRSRRAGCRRRRRP